MWKIEIRQTDICEWTYQATNTKTGEHYEPGDGITFVDFIAAARSAAIFMTLARGVPTSEAFDFVAKRMRGAL
jgi:hypothetical protein